jgi:hypothetical protein
MTLVGVVSLLGVVAEVCCILLTLTWVGSSPDEILGLEQDLRDGGVLDVIPPLEAWSLDTA